MQSSVPTVTSTQQFSYICKECSVRVQRIQNPSRHKQCTLTQILGSEKKGTQATLYQYSEFHARKSIEKERKKRHGYTLWKIIYGSTLQIRSETEKDFLRKRSWQIVCMLKQSTAMSVSSAVYSSWECLGLTNPKGLSILDNVAQWLQRKALGPASPAPRPHMAVCGPTTADIDPQPIICWLPLLFCFCTTQSRSSEETSLPPCMQFISIPHQTSHTTNFINRRTRSFPSVHTFWVKITLYNESVAQFLFPTRTNAYPAPLCLSLSQSELRLQYLTQQIWKFSLGWTVKKYSKARTKNTLNGYKSSSPSCACSHR